MREQYMRCGEGFIICYSITDRYYPLAIVRIMTIILSNKRQCFFLFLLQAQLQRGGGVPQPDRQGARLRRGPRHPRRQQGGEEERDDDQEEYADDCPLLANCDDIWLQGYTTVPVEVSVTCLGSFFPSSLPH